MQNSSQQNPLESSMGERIKFDSPDGDVVKGRKCAVIKRADGSIGNSFIPETREERIACFWTKVKKRSDEECWNWIGSKSKLGYGSFRWDGSSKLAHRVSLEIKNGVKLTGDVLVCHKCDNPSCVNPSHLFTGSYKDNAQDREKKGRGGWPSISGEKCKWAKLKSSDVAKIKEIHEKSNTSHRKLAKMFGVSKSHVSRILSGKKWKILA